MKEAVLPIHPRFTTPASEKPAPKTATTTTTTIGRIGSYTSSSSDRGRNGSDGVTYDMDVSVETTAVKFVLMQMLHQSPYFNEIAKRCFFHDNLIYDVIQSIVSGLRATPNHTLFGLKPNQLLLELVFLKAVTAFFCELERAAGVLPEGSARVPSVGSLLPKKYRIVSIQAMTFAWHRRRSIVLKERGFRSLCRGATGNIRRRNHCSSIISRNARRWLKYSSLQKWFYRVSWRRKKVRSFKYFQSKRSSRFFHVFAGHVMEVAQRRHSCGLSYARIMYQRRKQKYFRHWSSVTGSILRGVCRLRQLFSLSLCKVVLFLWHRQFLSGQLQLRDFQRMVFRKICWERRAIKSKISARECRVIDMWKNMTVNITTRRITEAVLVHFKSSLRLRRSAVKWLNLSSAMHMSNRCRIFYRMAKFWALSAKLQLDDRRLASSIYSQSQGSTCLLGRGGEHFMYTKVGVVRTTPQGGKTLPSGTYASDSALSGPVAVQTSELPGVFTEWESCSSPCSGSSTSGSPTV